ncbi:hypothetical protein [Corynebacterium liangguodongii]|uniref:Uncharacterized protein n=1 Tax=Corynebacterium liangguodongii TaxID=2079535 RepID=A0A2S0WCN1_9CORY|nr:hypothetical protein [Corynebacterium liangguodongii]AWB83525.1 hypothetical protein C3E79_02645 [Corynebacterium liangguodongii]PWC00386.1 hypothetical protein DF219_00310 [Corynebacterium liangguodongii]
MAGRLPLAEGEVVLADTTSPLSSMIFPLLEFVVVTGVCWGAIGWMDFHAVPAAARNLVVALWAIVGVVRFLLPLVAARRRRFVVTQHRVLARGRRGAIDSIPFGDIHSVRRERGGISVAVYGFERPLYFPEVGRARKVERVLCAQLGQG